MGPHPADRFANPILLHELQSLCRWVLWCCILLTPSEAFTQSFSKVNSGTRLNIRELKVDSHGNSYFLSDRISILKDNRWQRLAMPFSGRISRFFPISPDDIWFSTDEDNYTSQVFHFHKGVLEKMETPLTNQIFNISFTGSIGFFCSLSEIAIYKNGTFELLPTSSSNNTFIKIFGNDETDFWVLGNDGDIFRFRNGRYESPVKGRRVKDLCFSGPDHGYALLDNGILELFGGKVQMMISDTALSKVTRMQCISPNTLLATGNDGLMGTITNGQWRQYPPFCEENLGGAIVTQDNEIWVFGGNGRLLYQGNRHFQPYTDDLTGFSSHKLIALGVNSDNEYGVALADFNGDNRLDIYTACIYNPNRLYINKMVDKDKLPDEAGFVDEAARRSATGNSEPGLSPQIADLKLGVLASDLDNDGDQDLYLNYLKNNNRILLNEGKGHFRSMPQNGNDGCRDLNRSNASAAADVDLDGDLDLFVTSEEGSNRLLLNDGTGHFRDVTQKSGLSSQSGGMCASFGDINNDRLPDLCVTFWYPCNRLYINESSNGEVKFREITRETDLRATLPAKSNAILFGDVNNDGALDLFIGNRNQPDKLYLNDGKGKFRDHSGSWFPRDIKLTNGAVFADFDMDGFLDLYITNIGENILLRNKRGKGFEEITAAFGAETSGYGTGCGVGDVDNDADPDLFCSAYVQGSSRLFLNITDHPRSVEFVLRGTRSNRDAVGARIWLYIEQPGVHGRDSLCGYREVTAGNGYASSSSLQQIFGIDPGKNYYARILFPLSTDTILLSNLTAGKIYHVWEDNGLAAFTTDLRKAAARWITDREKQPELLKYLLVIILLLLYGYRNSNAIPRTRGIIWASLTGIFIIFSLINFFFLYTAFSFTFFIGLLVAAGLWLILHLFIMQFLARKVADKEKKELREKLSRDLHDDLASTLGSISIYSATLNDLEPGVRNNFRLLTAKIARLTQQALHSIADIIWMTSPRNDSLQSLLSKTASDMMELLSDNGMTFSADIQLPAESIRLSENVRNDAYLILKEGMHNCIKHSGADCVTLKATIDGHYCRIGLTDNGKGFDPLNPVGEQGSHSHGYGLMNMQKRSDESGLELELKSGSTGTHVNIRIKI